MCARNLGVLILENFPNVVVKVCLRLTLGQWSSAIDIHVDGPSFTSSLSVRDQVKPHAKPKKIPMAQQLHKVVCKKCKCYWGTIVKYKGKVQLPLLQSPGKGPLIRKLFFFFFELINSLQCYELTKRCSPLHLMLASLLIFAVFPWSIHCKCPCFRVHLLHAFGGWLARGPGVWTRSQEVGRRALRLRTGPRGESLQALPGQIIRPRILRTEGP